MRNGKFLLRLADHHIEDVNEALASRDCHVARIVYKEAGKYLQDARRKLRTTYQKQQASRLTRKLDRATRRLQEVCER